MKLQIKIKKVKNYQYGEKCFFEVLKDLEVVDVFIHLCMLGQLQVIRLFLSSENTSSR